MTRIVMTILVAAMPFAAGTFDLPSEPEQGSVILAKITKTNGGGNAPKGNANGVPSRNPAGKAPPGHNTKSTGVP